MAAAITCPDCKKKIPVEQFLDGCQTYLAEVRVLRCKCPGCHGVTEVQPEPGALWLGYVYAAGQPHFSAMEKIPVDGLRVSADSRSMEIKLGDRTWTLGIL